MAVSDNSKALPFVIQGGRRKCCAMDGDRRGGNVTHAVRLFAPVDPCVILLQDWEQAHHMAVVLCRLQQRLEIRIRNALRPVDGPEDDQQSTPQASTRIDRQARWDELDAEIGYSRARAAEAQAVEAEEEILDAVAATPAQSLAGVIAKLTIIVGGGETAGDMSAFPWPQIQSVLTDLQALHHADGGRGLDGEANRRRPPMSDGNTDTATTPRQS